MLRVALVVGLLVTQLWHSIAALKTSRISGWLAPEAPGISLNPITGVPNFIQTPEGSPGRPGPTAAANVEELARAFFLQYRELYKMNDPAAELKLTGIETDALGYRHVHFQQVAGGLEVFGAELIVHLAPDNQVTAVNGRYSPGVRVTAGPVMGLSSVLKPASQRFGLEDLPLPTGQAELLIYDPAVTGRGPSRPRLAYRVRAENPTRPEAWVMFIDANSGQVLYEFSAIQEAKIRDVLDQQNLPNTQPVFCYIDDVLVVPNVPQECIDAYMYAGNVYDYYHANFGRDSFDNAGAKMTSRVRIPSSQAGGAAGWWNGSYVSYQTNYVNLYLAGHEWTHGVINYEANFNYINQGGALSEGYADLFGRLIFRATNPSGQWEAIMPMSEYVCPTGNGMDRQYNRRILASVARLVDIGGSYNGYTIAAQGDGPTGQVFYRALAYYLTSTSVFSDAYDSLVQSCSDLYGAESATCAAVKNALDAVGLKTNVSPCTPEPISPPNQMTGQGPTNLLWTSMDPNNDPLTYNVYFEAGNPTPAALACTGITAQECAAPALSAGQTYYWQVEALDGSASVRGPVWSLTAPTGQTAAFPITQNFENGALGAGWTVTNTGHGRGHFYSTFPYEGTKALTLESALYDTVDSTSILRLKINLAGVSTAVLDYQWRNATSYSYGYNGASSGVFLSMDNGTSWRQVSSFFPVSTNYRHVYIDLVQAAAAAGGSLTNQTLLEFRYAGSRQTGILLDLVQVTANPIPPFTSCDNQTSIPASECAALTSLYQSTAGSGWTDHSGWLAYQDPCSWKGVTCASGHVSGLVLIDNYLAGSLPAALLNLTYLQTLDLSENVLSGSLPAGWEKLTNLETLKLVDNQLTGPIPVALGSLTKLVVLDLRYNQFSGPIPSDLGNLKELFYLYLGINNLTGAIPASLGQLSGLFVLDLRQNYLDGAIPSELGNLKTLGYLYLTRNALQGEIPTSLASLPLLYLDLSYNRLTASDPGLISFLDSKNSTWKTTQTVPPTGLSAAAAPGGGADLTWTEIGYSIGSGSYEISYATAPGGPYQVHGLTSSKAVTTYYVSNLSASQNYYFRLRTHTPANALQKNDLWSSYTNPVSLPGGKQTQTITVTVGAPVEASLGEQFTVAATASSGLPVTYSSGSPSICTNNGAVFTIVAGSGICLVRFNQSGNAAYLPAPEVTRSVIVNFHKTYLPALQH